MEDTQQKAKPPGLSQSLGGWPGDWPAPHLEAGQESQVGKGWDPEDDSGLLTAGGTGASCDDRPACLGHTLLSPETRGTSGPRSPNGVCDPRTAQHPRATVPRRHRLTVRRPPAWLSTQGTPVPAPTSRSPGNHPAP